MIRDTGYREWEDRVLPLEDKPLAVSSCGHYQFRTLPRFYTNRPDGRGDWQLIYLAKGAMEVIRDGVTYREKAPFLLLYRPHEPQHYGYRLQDGPEVFWIHFGGYDVEEQLRTLGLFQGESFCYPEESAHVSFLFLQILSELQMRERFFCPVIDALLPRLLCEFARCLHQASTKALSPTTQQAVKYFHRHFASPLPLRDYAAKLGMTHSGFCHLFTREMKRPPSAYLQALRLNTAKELLLSTVYSVGEIAAQVGYSDPLYFSRLFTRREGISPTEYRKRSQKREALP